MIPRAGAEPLHLYILIGSASEARMECTDSVIVMSVYPVFRWSCWVVARDAMLRPEFSVPDNSLIVYHISYYDIDCRRKPDHLPANTGFRFSTNALTPSRASAVREVAASVCASSSNWLSSDPSSVWENKRLIAPYASVGPAASSRAIRSASPCTALSGTTKSTIPSDRPVLASSVSPSRKKRLARATPMRRVTVVVDPLSGLNPIFAKADEMRADSAMTTRSAAAISDTLPPATLPETEATTGARIRTIRAIAA